MAIVMFALFVTIYEIFTNQIKGQKFNLESEGREVEKMRLAPFVWTKNV